ncbi:MAG: site-2 protease family protein [Candidatus Omnitrophota bacterium]
MKGSIKLFTAFGIEIRIHITFLLLPLLFGFVYASHGIMTGVRAVVVIFFVFICVVMHELCHSLVAKKYGIAVKDITLLPIGGIASMQAIPDNPKQEFAISIAGPSFNLIFAAIIFFPIYLLVGENIRHPGFGNWQEVLAYMFWINPILAFFNLLPAFPMDGGRVLRSVLARKMEYGHATRIAVGLGHTFSLIFGFLGIVSANIILILIAIFIYVAASQEGLQVDLRLTLRRFKVKDILPANFVSVEQETPFSKILELIFHTHQENFPVVENSKLTGLICRNDILFCMHQGCADKKAKDFMRADIKAVSPEEPLNKVYLRMQEFQVKALPVVQRGVLKGIITLEDISRVYHLLSQNKY